MWPWVSQSKTSITRAKALRSPSAYQVLRSQLSNPSLAIWSKSNVSGLKWGKRFRLARIKAPNTLAGVPSPRKNTATVCTPSRPKAGK